jgi:hypothetical protein
VRFVREGEIQPLTPRLVAQRNRLLENQLLDLQRRRLQIESERDDKIRRDLQLEIEAEREAAEPAAPSGPPQAQAAVGARRARRAKRGSGRRALPADNRMVG